MVLKNYNRKIKVKHITFKYAIEYNIMIKSIKITQLINMT
jgi:hypothetical protein